MDIKVPAVGESITEATIGEWVKGDGDYVQRDEILLLLETDKASVEVVAEASGQLKISVAEGETVDIGAVIGNLDTEAAAPAGASGGAPASQSTNAEGESPTAGTGASAPTSDSMAAGAAATPSPFQGPMSPAVRRVVGETGLDPATVQGTGKGGRLTKGDVLKAASASAHSGGSTSPQLGGQTATSPSKGGVSAPGASGASRGTERVKMTTFRKKIAQRLVQAQQTAAILTTFNEVDMTQLMALRNQYKEPFEKKHGVRLGFMGFFVKAALSALKETPEVNAFIDGDHIVYNQSMNIGIAVSSPRGLVVPVLKNAQDMSLAEIEMNIRNYALKARDGKITIDDMSGGTFTISNGGVFGSLMSTPILNPPQSGILGMHKIEKRPVVVNDQVVVRPMMYLALSYDHRMIDGKQSVGFLVRIKECIEDPSRILMEI